MVAHYVLVLHLQEEGGAVGQEAAGDQGPPVGGAGTEPLHGTSQLFLLPVHQRQVVRILPLLNDVVCCLGTSEVFVAMLNFWGVLVWKPVRSNEINVLIAELPKS